MQHQANLAELIGDGAVLSPARPRTRKNRLILRVSRRGAALVLAPDGNIDSANAAEFRDRILRAIALAPRQIVIDFGRVGAISSHGLRALAHAHRMASETGVKMVLEGRNCAVREIFSIAGLERVFAPSDGFPPVFEAGHKAFSRAQNGF